MQATNSGAVAAMAGQSLAIMNTNKAPAILDMRAAYGVTGTFNLKANSICNMAVGLQYNVVANQMKPLTARGTVINPQPQEVLQPTISGSGAAVVDGVLMQMLYGEYPGVMMRAGMWDEVLKRVAQQFQVQVTLVGAAAGQTGSVALNASQDFMTANRNYALFGITTNLSCLAIGLTGLDTGNQFVGVPGDAGDNDGMQQYFLALSAFYKKPLVPIINSGNKTSTFLSFVQNQTNISPKVTLHMGLIE